MCCAVLCLVAQSCLTLRPLDCNLPGSSVHGGSPDKNTGVGCHALLQAWGPGISGPAPPVLVEMGPVQSTLPGQSKDIQAIPVWDGKLA